MKLGKDKQVRRTTLAVGLRKLCTDQRATATQRLRACELLFEIETKGLSRSSPNTAKHLHSKALSELIADENIPEFPSKELAHEISQLAQTA